MKAIDDRGVVVDMQTGRCWELNAMGFAIWQRLAEGKSLQEVSDLVASLYGVEIETSVRDVSEFARALVDAALLEPSSSIPATSSNQ